MTTSERRLAGFEERQLAELREHVAARAAVTPARRPRGRLLLAASAVAAGVCAAVAIPAVSGDGGEPAYAVTKGADGVVYAELRDSRDAAGLSDQLRRLGVPAIVDHVPEGRMCREPRGKHVEDIPPDLYHVPESIPGEKQGWRMRIDTRLFKPGQTFVWTVGENSTGGTSTSTILMEGPVAPCVLVDAPERKEYHPDSRRATVKGRSLAGYRVDEKTVGEVVPEIEKRGLKVVYLVISVPPGNPGGFGEDHIQETPVGKDWTVWEAEEVVKGPKDTPTGVIRLLVTKEHYDRNPVYGGPRDAVVPDGS
ncbi:hypothetical protein ACFYSC_06440 [Streptosporangium sp. NPDC004379]|uniref:hypothetical protein n=1 Tax=Streptosporangium sp. NPDC004379 TaxID=3366189 RepID=UPI00368EE654